MGETVIKVEGLSKQYRLGQVGTGTIANDIKRWWYLLRGKEDPFIKISEINDRTKTSENDYVWSLKDINFEVQRGEVLGIIGKNGAGKSTLLKILSQVTSPTTGSIKVKGKIASLLEVGTGFHPDLTGRENIFLNGAILGMRKAEIKSKFDEIVAFSGVERYIDTPVKRYSSGMYVRLAFAVAAHLDPDILIVDEVLAVGDAEFQKKCLGKMKDVSGEGRTVLFVSHNMPSMRALCSRVMILQNGIVTNMGETNEMIASYLTSQLDSVNDESGIIPKSLSTYHTGEAKFQKIQILDLAGKPQKEFSFKECFNFCFFLEAFRRVEDVLISIFIVNSYGENVLMIPNNDNYQPINLEAGLHEYSIEFKTHLMPGNYSVGLAISFYHTGSMIDYVDSFYSFKINKETKTKNMEYPWSTVHGYTVPNFIWTKK